MEPFFNVMVCLMYSLQFLDPVIEIQGGGNRPGAKINLLSLLQQALLNGFEGLCLIMGNKGVNNAFELTKQDLIEFIQG